MTEDENEARVITPDAGASASAGPGATSLDSDIQGKIGQHLRAMYDDVVRQGVPSRFLDLLAQLDEPAGSGKKSGGGAAS